MKPQGAHAHEDRLLDFAYDELPPTEARLVEQHVQGCSRCSETLADIRGVRTTMSRLPLESAPDAGLESLLAYAQQSARRAAAGPEPAPRWWRRLLAPALSVAALSVFGVVVIQVNREVDLSPSLAQHKEAPREKTRGRGEQAEVADTAAAPASPAPPEIVPTSAPVPADIGKVHAEMDEEMRAAMPPSKAMPKKAPSKMGSGRGASLGDDWNLGSGSAGGFPDKKLALESEGKASKSKRDAPGGMALPSVSTAQRAEPAEVASEEYAAGAPMAEAVQSAPPEPMQPLRGSASRAAPAASKNVADDDVYEQKAPARSQVASAAPPPPAPAAQYQQPAVASAGAVARTDALESRKKEVAQQSAERAATRYSPTPAELMKQAEVAHRSGDWAQEVDFLRAALSAGARGSQRLEALSRLCEAEFAMGRQQIAAQVCKTVMDEAPGSSAARTAQRRLERELPSSADEAGIDVKTTAPIKK
ncbi:MAG TPA: zf-HC2 domain-containing protein [Archangium sp.]|uniref:zf-HC2 domain-containing protein n=1 Tax=Archangium sp. TaxID=1872627 RepID=UPI002E32DA01|nr:zf-HC2 domain-containing protein [Archangium sp.]HEX5747878.1 zf-HC2 domain-containing protein [Archangium sp.]